MKKFACAILVVGLVVFSHAAQGQDTWEPVLERGTQELGIAGQLDFQGPAGGVDLDMALSYGWFYKPLLEIGGYGAYSRQLDGDFKTYSIGAFAEQHLRYSVNSIPYVGLRVGLQFTDTDIASDEAALIFTPKIGLKWFFRDNIAIDFNFFFSWATDDVYVNDNDLDQYDMGLNLGLRAFFN